MKKSIQSVFLAFVVLTVLLSGCAPAPAPTPIPPTLTPSPMPIAAPAAATVKPAVTPDNTPAPTAILEPAESPSPTEIAERVNPAPWLKGAGTPVALDVATVGPAGFDAWVTVAPQTGEYKRRAPIAGHVPNSLTPNSRYALVETEKGLEVLDAVDETLTEVGPGWTGEISLNGRWAAIIPAMEGPTLAVVNVESGKRFDLGEMGKPVHLAWSPDDRLTIVKNGTLYLAEGPDWRPRQVGAFPYVRPEWSPDGQWIAFIEKGQVRIARPDLSAVRTLARAEGGLAWSPDGQRLAYATAEGVYAVSVASGAVTNVSPVAVVDGLPRLFWSPDGSAIAFAAFDSKRHVTGIVVARADGSGAYQITEGIVGVLGWMNEGIVAYVCRCL